ncbi:MAG: hypothetical protein JO036_11545 [Candidatus Eremiobacteraeota bacterium]|nr:hypothetical protein [Candidatus Eremiobacteraeota bacterium]
MNLRRALRVHGTMRLPLAAALVLALAVPVAARTAVAQTAPSPADTVTPAAAPCAPRQTLLGGVGRASVVSFVGPVFGAPVCATVANLSFDGFTARIADAPAADALVTAALTGGGSLSVPLEGATLAGAGPWVVAPGGTIPDFGGDTAEAPRVVLAYAGQRVLVIATTPVALVDLAKELRTHPDRFGADAIERAVVIASGPNAAVSLRGDDGLVGASAVQTPKVLLLVKRT